MKAELAGNQITAGADIKGLALSVRDMPQAALDRIFLSFSKLASQVGASILQANDFATAATFIYSAVSGMAPRRDAIMAAAIKSIVARLIIRSGAIGGLEGAAQIDDKDLAIAIAGGNGLSIVKLNKAYREIKGLKLEDTIRSALGTLMEVGGGSAGGKVQKLLGVMHDENYDLPSVVSEELMHLSMHRGISPTFVRFMSDMYIYASNPLKVALLAAVHENSGLGNYRSIADEAAKRFNSLGMVKAGTLYASLKRDSGVCGIRCLGRKADGKYEADADVWALAAWASYKGFRITKDIAHEGFDTVATLFGVETKSRLPHSLSLYAIFDTISHNQYRPMRRSELMKSAESRGWCIDIRHSLNMLSRSGIIHFEGCSKPSRLELDRDIMYRAPEGGIGEEGIEAIIKARPYLKGSIPGIIKAINEADSAKGFSVYDICKSSGVFLQGVEKVMHGLADMGFLVKDQQEFVIVPSEAARVAWDVFFKPLGDIAAHAAYESSIKQGIADASIICRKDSDWVYGKESFNDALDLMINRYACTEIKKVFGSSYGKMNSPREFVMRAMEGHEGLTRKQILESIALMDSRMNEDRLSWYLLQLRREGKVAKVGGRYTLSRH